jgi:hypothetical protein
MRKRVVPLAVAVVVAALLLAVVLRAPIERAVVTSLLQRATGLSVDMDEIREVPGGIALGGFRARSENGDLRLQAPRVVLTRSGAGFDVEFDGLQATAAVGSWTAPLDRATAFARRFLIGEGSLAARLHDCSLLLTGGDMPSWNLAFRSIDGTVRQVGRVASYDVSGALADGNATYPVSAHSEVLADRVTDRWTAAALPLAPLAALVSEGPVHVSGGRLTGVDLTLVRDPYGLPLSLKANAHVEDGSASLSGDRVHDIRGLHGALVLNGDALASVKIAGSVDAIPLDVSGEADGFAPPGSRPSKGARDLLQLARLLAGIADQPSLTSIHVETTAPGAAFGQYGLTTEHGPLAVQVIAIDPHEPTLRWDTALSNDRIISGGERTSEMGLRTGAIAGVNGDYFDIGRTYQPQGLLISHGELLRGPTDRQALLIHRDGSVSFGEYRLRGTLATPHGDFPVTQLNNWPAGEVTVITPAFGKELPPADGVTFAVLIPLKQPGEYRVGTVTPMSEPVPVRFGLAFGPLARAELHPGEEIHLKFALDPPAAEVVAGIGGGPLLLRDGQWFEDPHAPAPDERDVRWPVVALARLSDDSLLLVAVDGRHPERSVGMTRPEFADLLRNFKAVDAMALDSGGSVTMVSRAPGDAKVSVRNVPSDNSAERWVSDGLFLYSSAPAPALLEAAKVPAVSLDP